MRQDTVIGQLLSVLATSQAQRALIFISALILLPYVLERRRKLLAAWDPSLQIQARPWNAGFGRTVVSLLVISLVIWLVALALALLEGGGIDATTFIVSAVAVFGVGFLLIAFLAAGRIALYLSRKGKS